MMPTSTNSYNPALDQGRENDMFLHSGVGAAFRRPDLMSRGKRAAGCRRNKKCRR